MVPESQIFGDLDRLDYLSVGDSAWFGREFGPAPSVSASDKV